MKYPFSLIVFAINTIRVYPENNYGGNHMNHVRIIREGAGITQASLRRALGWNQSRLANYESGLRSPGLSEARLIVIALNELGAICVLDEVFPPDKENLSAA
ncbi:helix-turn-helix transcriptional regulator [Pseudomonas syringae]|uniref:helix-turn-helix transcriptional regulator n=1 Tax=Pseudomonas TaxID=286 RepID=UPI0035B5996E